MATRKRTIPRTKLVGPELTASVEEYLLNRSMRERSDYHETRIKKDLLGIIDAAGEVVDEHKKVIELKSPLDYTQYKAGKPVKKVVTGIERRERVTKTLDEDKTLALLKRKGLTKQCVEVITITNVSEDAVLAANYAGQITDKELEALWNESITPAFYLTEGSDQ